jgi:hypothetical protein
MSDSSSSFAGKTAASRDALRIVLLGMPGAGKTFLLGALAQAGQKQQSTLMGRLVDGVGCLAELQERVYNGLPERTNEEAGTYTLVYESLRPQAPDGRRLEIVLIDLEGRIAESVLTDQACLHNETSAHRLARAVLQSDALLLMVDAAAEPEQFDATLALLKRYLGIHEQTRGRRSEAGGQPVALVLTKCDLLAQPADTARSWIERIEDCRQRVQSYFREYLDKREAQGPVPFGRIDLYLAPTAIQRPALVDGPSKAREPFGVAELFRETFERARLFRRRTVRSQRRLFWAAAGCTGAMAAMIVLVISLLFYRPPETYTPRELLAKVESYRLREPQTPSLRLREPLQPKISELVDLKNDADFPELPQDKRDYVLTHLQELDDYRAYKDKIERIPSLNGVRNEQELSDVEKALQELEITEHRPGWSQTEAILRRTQRLGEIAALRATAAGLADRYAQLLHRGQELLIPAKDVSMFSWRDWHDRVQRLLHEAETSPLRASDPLLGPVQIQVVALRLQKVADAREAWETVKRSLERVRDVSSALGLAGGGRAPLDIPFSFTLSQAASRLQDLEREFPRFKDDFNLIDLPDALAGELRRAAQPRYEHLLKAGREVVLTRYQLLWQGGAETFEDWRKLRSWLAAPEELQTWRLLAALLSRLQSPDAADPVSVLDSFLAQDHFKLTIRRLVLQIPDAAKIRPAGKLVIHHHSGSENKPALTYEVAEEERQDSGARYHLRPLGETSLAYQPGDLLWAELPVTAADQTPMMLTWARNRSQVYQFERLERPPRLHRKGQDNTEGEVLEAVSLLIAPEDGVPKIPDLMPVVPVKAEKR